MEGVFIFHCTRNFLYSKRLYKIKENGNILHDLGTAVGILMRIGTLPDYVSFTGVWTVSTASVIHVYSVKHNNQRYFYELQCDLFLIMFSR